MIVLVCGSRDWDDAVRLFAECSHHVDQYRAQVLHESYAQVTVLEGDSGRADVWADAWGQLEGHKVLRFPAKWREDGVYNPNAGRERNLAMLDEEPDLVIAFQKNNSRGTQHTIDNARERGIDVEVITA